MKDEVVLQTGKEKRRFQADSKQIIKVLCTDTENHGENRDNGSSSSSRTVNVYHRAIGNNMTTNMDAQHTDWLILLKSYERQLPVIKKVIDFFSLLVDKKNVCVCVFVWEYWLVFLAPTSAIAASDNTHIGNLSSTSFLVFVNEFFLSLSFSL